MLEIKPLSICNFEEVVALYKKMIEENIGHDERLRHIDIGDRSIRNMLQYSFDIEDDAFYVAYWRNTPIGFIDSARVSQEGKPDEWYIKSVFLESEFRGTNYFHQLLSRVEKEVVQKSIRVIFSNALMDNDEANNAWEAAGYVVEGKRRVKVL